MDGIIHTKYLYMIGNGEKDIFIVYHHVKPEIIVYVCLTINTLNARTSYCMQQRLYV